MGGTARPDREARKRLDDYLRGAPSKFQAGLTALASGFHNSVSSSATLTRRASEGRAARWFISLASASGWYTQRILNLCLDRSQLVAAPKGATAAGLTGHVWSFGDLSEAVLADAIIQE